MMKSVLISYTVFVFTTGREPGMRELYKKHTYSLKSYPSLDGTDNDIEYINDFLKNIYKYQPSLTWTMTKD